jgi:hypothetical protein
MKKIWRKMKCGPAALCFAVVVLHGVSVHAQAYDKMIIHAGDSIKNHISYLFPAFTDALVKFRDGRSFVYKMNFNLVLCDMQYINKKGDTLAITNGELIDTIRMESCYFIYDYQKGYFQIIDESDAGRLAVYRRTSFQPVQTGGYGEGRQSGGVEMISSLNGKQGSLPLVLNQDMYIVRKTSYFLIDKGGAMENASKPAFLKIYSGDKKSFDQFVKANKINYNDQGDLEKLFNFCTHAG